MTNDELKVEAKTLKEICWFMALALINVDASLPGNVKGYIPIDGSLNITTNGATLTIGPQDYFFDNNNDFTGTGYDPNWKPNEGHLTEEDEQES